MTQPAPDPELLPEAIPMLSYERQSDDRSMVWVVRFTGAWFVCTAAMPLFTFVVRVGLSLFLSGATRGAALLWMLWISLQGGAIAAAGSLVMIVFAIAMIHQRRYGFIGVLILLWIVPILDLTRMMSGPFASMFAIVLASTLRQLAVLAVQFAMVLSVLRRASACGAIEPMLPDRPAALPEGRSISFLVSRMGWLFLAEGGVALVYLAIWRILIMPGWSVGGWSWQTTVQVGLYTAVASCGWLLHQRRTWAIWPLVGLLPLQAVGFQVMNMWRIFPQGGLYWVTMIAPPAAGAIASVVMLCILARRASLERGTN